MTFRARGEAITVASVSPLAYVEEVEVPRHPGLHPGLHTGLHQVAPLPGGGSVVGGPDRFARADVDTGPENAAEVKPHLLHRNGLTPRDVVVLRFLAEGWTTADIAHQLAYAESTIKKEVHIIVHRLGARNRTHAVALAIRASFI